MGMDVIGRHPSNKVGEYFGRTVCGWDPLADYVLQVAPDTTSACKHWHSNDGDGLNKLQSVKLSEILRDELASGRAVKYIHRQNSTLAAMPDEECHLCGATGKRDGYKPCSVCNSTGWVRPWAAHYCLTVSDIEMFADFLESCGGFAVY